MTKNLLKEINEMLDMNSDKAINILNRASDEKIKALIRLFKDGGVSDEEAVGVIDGWWVAGDGGTTDISGYEYYKLLSHYGVEPAG